MALADERMVAQGWQAMAWGFSSQGPEGNFAGTGDSFHSVSIFAEAAARCLLLMQQSGRTEYQTRIAQYAPRLRAAAQWLARLEVAAEGQRRDFPCAHRRWLPPATTWFALIPFWRRMWRG